jgi:hypothetical protein
METDSLKLKLSKHKIMKTKLVSISLLLLLTITIYSCRRVSPAKNEANNQGLENLSLSNDIPIGCFDSQTQEGMLKYNSNIIDHFLYLMMGSSDQVSDSRLLREYDSASSQYKFYIVANYMNPLGNGSFAIGLDISGDDILYNVSVPKCKHTCDANGVCDCEVWGINDCQSHSCSKTCPIDQPNASGCGQSIGPASTVGAPTATEYINQQTPEC